MSLSDSPASSSNGYVFPLPPRRPWCHQISRYPKHTKTRPAGASQVPRLISRHAPSSHTPESPTVAHTHNFTVDAGFTTSGRLATLTCLSRPIQVHLRYGSRRHRSRLRQRRLPAPTLDWLRVLWVITRWRPFTPPDQPDLAWRTGMTGLSFRQQS